MRPPEQPTHLGAWGPSWPKWTKKEISMPSRLRPGNSRIRKWTTLPSYLKLQPLYGEWTSSWSTSKASDSSWTQIPTHWKNLVICTVRPWTDLNSLTGAWLRYTVQKGVQHAGGLPLQTSRHQRDDSQHFCLRSISSRSLQTPDARWDLVGIQTFRNTNQWPPNIPKPDQAYYTAMMDKLFQAKIKWSG